VNFRLHPDERLAFVGENGAGKTTLIKLLARLYDPTEGHILLDEVDLRDYDLQSVRQAVGVIFQDFVRYDLRFDENIGIGEIDEVRSYLDRSDHGSPAMGRDVGHRPPAVARFRYIVAAARNPNLSSTGFRRVPADARPAFRSWR
jgi:ABC-type branched-subunit amino acid transport system ATPase component